MVPVDAPRCQQIFNGAWFVGCGRGTLLQPQYRQPPGMSLESACALQGSSPAVPYAAKISLWLVSEVSRVTGITTTVWPAGSADRLSPLPWRGRRIQVRCRGSWRGGGSAPRVEVRSRRG